MPDDTYYNLKRLHAVFAASSLALLAVTVWMVAADHQRPWKAYQRQYRDQIEPRLTEAHIRQQEQNREHAPGDGEPSERLEHLHRELAEEQPNWGKGLLRLPIIDALGRPLRIAQIWLPDLTIDYHFQQVARFDRCVTCHLGIEKPLPGGVAAPAGRTDPVIESARAEPYSPHPRLDLFVGPHSPHPMQEFGCTICHDGQGSATDFTWASHTPDNPAERVAWRGSHGWFRNADWDLPMLPARFAQSRCIKCHHDVTDLEPSDRFPEPPAAKLVAGYNLVRQLGCFGCHEIKGVSEAGRSLGPDMRLEPNDPRASAVAGADPAAPGTMRKVGPSLRHVASKLDAAYLAAWISRPAALRPQTRMPQLFGLYEHLEGKSLADTRRLEQAEVQAVAAYLLDASRPAELPRRPAGVTEPASVQRGKQLFLMHGCLACHKYKHGDLPESKSTFGPDLSDVGTKLATPQGRAWLEGWLRDPASYAPRTLMPNPLLEPLALPDPAPSGAGAGQESAVHAPRMTDPVADIAAFLLDSASPSPRPSPARGEGDIDELALGYLSALFPQSTAEEYLKHGIPASMAGEVQGDARELLGPVSLQKKLRYVGRRTIRKRGCFGCHDIPGLEDAQPIGPALSDWGRKQESQLAFEAIDQYLTQTPAGRQETAGADADPDRGFYLEALRGQRREGFIWQKLQAPRSFDYQRAQTKGFHQQLLMGRFTLSAEDREAIITFVLGLVGQPPAEKYLARGDRRRQAVVQGRKVLDRYGCAQCHTLRMEAWQIEYDPQTFPSPPALADYDFLKPQVTAAALAASRKTDLGGRGHAQVVGTPQVDAQGNLVEDVDDDDNPLYFFTLFEPAVINGQVWPVGGAQLAISKPQLAGKRPPWGGDFARLLYPAVLEAARRAGASPTGMEAWGWVPPALVHEGAKVQPAWLHDFLLNPYAIRPAAVLRMPKYNLSPEEAAQLVDYFAAASGAEFPYSSDVRSRGIRPAADAPGDMARLDAALGLVTDRKTYCTKCHLLGDYSPGGETRTVLAPKLDGVGGRIRPEYLRQWLANPRSVLPYTAMPVNFPPGGEPLDRSRFDAPSPEQLDAVMELLLNYEGYMSRRTSIRAMIESSP